MIADQNTSTPLKAQYVRPKSHLNKKQLLCESNASDARLLLSHTYKGFPLGGGRDSLNENLRGETLQSRNMTYCNCTGCTEKTPTPSL